MQIGLHLLEDFVASKRKAINVPNTSSSSCSVVPASAAPSFALNSPAPHIVKDDLIPAFARLDMQSFSFIDSRPIEYHLENEGLRSDCIASMPAIFVDIQEAKKFYELLMRRLMHRISSIYHLRKGGDGLSQAGQFLNRLFSRNEWTLDVNDKGEDGGILNRDNAPLDISLEAYVEKQMHLVGRSCLCHSTGAYTDILSLSSAFRIS